MKKSMKIMVSAIWSAAFLIGVWSGIGLAGIAISELRSLDEKTLLATLFYGVIDIFGLVLAVLMASFSCFFSLHIFARIITISEEGITARVLFLKRKVPWERIEEWGIGKTVIYGFWGRRNALYFSTKELSLEEREEVTCHNRSILLLRPDDEDTVFFVRYTPKRWAFVNSLEAVKAKKKKEIEASCGDVTEE